MVDFSDCPLCGSDRIFSLRGYEKDFLARCKNCSFVFCRKIPSQEELKDYYSRYPALHAVPPLTIKRYNQLLDAFEKYRRTNNILDVGCGEGFFLEEALKRGWNVYGTEYAAHYIDICEKKGIAMKAGVFNPANYATDFFDVIISIEVIEHLVPNETGGVQEIKNYKQVLRNGGIIYFTTPNFNSLSRRLLKWHWNILQYPEHLCYYTPKTIGRLLSSAGLHILNLHSTGISVDRLRAGLKRKQAERKKAATQERGNTPVSLSSSPTTPIAPSEPQLRDTIENNFLLRMGKAVLNKILTLTRSGDTLKVLAQKPL